MTQSNKPYDVAVILINYNSSNHTINCIRSIIEKTDSNLKYKIIVIDNASTNDDFNNLLASFKSSKNNENIHIFRSRINLGFSGGNMLGIQFANAKYYFFLNNDCELQNDCITILHKFCELNNEVALCSPQLYDTKGLHQPCIDYFPFLSTKLFGLGILKFFYKDRYFKRKKLYEHPIQVDVVSGSQMFTRADTFDNIGGLDTTYFLYCEEEDLAFRLHKAGHKTYLVPEAKNIHLGGGSTVDSIDIRKEFYISFLFFYRKHFGFMRTILLRIFLFLKTIKKSFSDRDMIQIAFFILLGAPLTHSLQYQHKLISLKKKSY